MRFQWLQRLEQSTPVALAIALSVLMATVFGCESEVLDPFPVNEHSGGGSTGAGAAGDGGSRDPQEPCPASLPTDGHACQYVRGDCEFDQTTCDCHNESWVCWDLSDCPENRPEDGSDCPRVGIECDYGPRRCDCEDWGWDCRDGSN
jgi:hypothetical protein